MDNYLLFYLLFYRKSKKEEGFSYLGEKEEEIDRISFRN
ncbi:hypothetical protein E5S67_05332 [Microcoleus sp. IPMA8]|uniref:Uncharacterized protein n=1 Tax=Microcoleus asticus IPMA8 TaxID=2563858 RepID=A0ABX2D6W1_9CYAN|nr:hypothetical protein [Microcoleus asticus IPMA8]